MTRLLVVLTAVLFVGCGSGSEEAGVVRGTLREVGGPPPGMDRPVVGTVTLTRSNGVRIRVKTADGRFRVKVAPGTYRLQGTSPLFNSGESTCTGARVLVGANRITQADVTCAIP